MMGPVQYVYRVLHNNVQVCVSKTLYARVYMWLNVTDCHRALALQVASQMLLLL
jgi:hypothetical protein